MHWLEKLIILAQVVFVAGIAVALVYVLVHRLRTRKHETFEEREN